MKVLITSVLDEFGHVISVIRFGLVLKKRGHEVIFTHRKSFYELAKKFSLGFIEFDGDVFDGVKANPAAGIVGMLEEYFVLKPTEALEKFLANGFFNATFLSKILPKTISRMNDALKRVLEQVSDVDMVVIDQSMYKLPVLFEKNIPHVDIFPMSPLLLYSDSFPPWLGLTRMASRESYLLCKNSMMKAFQTLARSVKHLYNGCHLGNSNDEEFGLDFHLKPKYLGFYQYPRELDYSNLEPIIGNYHRIDSLLFDSDYITGTFCIPEKFNRMPGKLIYFSMGTMMSSCQNIIGGILRTLSMSPNRFIVTSGGNKFDDSLIDSYENIWCCKFVDQLAVLNQVDLIIFHGGNNTMMEALYLGLPMIIIPLVADQLDNAQSVEDKELGAKMFLWDFDSKKLLHLIEIVLTDEKIHRNVRKISSDMHQSKSADEAVDLIEDLYFRILENRQIKSSSL
ncbi:uncharacterized protein LOC141848761 [Brevipalpus obovatus]|uniref:uncharacterized protein LOC141848761 n=1 Tax=Brevipalpus obovatus TaxID=246614 RepID=UPI003D9EAE50